MSDELNDILVSIMILSWNKPNEIIKAIQSAISQTYINKEIVVVDNNSSDNSIEIIRNTFPNIKIISLDKNYGCPGGRNKGIQYCNGDYIFFLDDDGILHKDAVKNAIQTIREYPNAGIVSGVIQDINEYYDMKNNSPKKKLFEVSLFLGGVCLIRKDIFSKIAEYPYDYIYGGEESFMSYRIMDEMIGIIKNESVLLFHPLNNYINKNEMHKKSFENVLVTAYQIYPIIGLIIYAIYYFTVYPFYAAKYNFLIDYFKIIKNAIIRFQKYKRKPIKLKVFVKSLILNRKPMVLQ